MDVAGGDSVNIGAGTVYAHWFGDAQGPYNFGVLGVKIQFTPAGGTTVPLPRSLMLLVSGLGLLFGWQRRRAPELVSG
jgi:MYXO-CTERM domain-containing protein